MKTILDNFGKYIPPLTAVLLLVSILYDYLFLASLGLSFAEVPTTFQDHARSALLWLPITILFAAIFWIKTVLHHRTVTESASTTESKLDAYEITRDILLFATAALLIVFSRNPAFLILALLIIILQAPGIFMRSLGIGKEASSTIKLAVLVASLTLTIVALKAYIDGTKMLEGTHKWSVGIQTIDGNQMLLSSGIRTFSSSTIVVQLNGNTKIISNKNISNIALEIPANYEITYICRYFGYLC